MIACISQPRYLPFLGYFHRFFKCDIWIHLDTVQYTPRDWENRNKIKTSQGWSWLTVPVKSSYCALIPDVKVNYDHPWQYKHWETIRTCYRKAPFFELYSERVESLYKNPEWESLSDLNIHSTQLLCELLGFQPKKVFRASELNVEGKGSDLILNLCEAVGATVYLSGSEGKNYLDIESFTKNNIKLQIQEYQHPNYHQQFGEFMPNMAVIDLLMNCGPESLSILSKNQRIIEL